MIGAAPSGAVQQRLEMLADAALFRPLLKKEDFLYKGNLLYSLLRNGRNGIQPVRYSGKPLRAKRLARLIRIGKKPAVRHESDLRRLPVPLSVQAAGSQVIVGLKKLPSSRIPHHNHTAALVQRAAQVGPQVIVGDGRKHRQVRDRAEERRVKDALMRLAVLAHNARAVHGENKVNVLQSGVMQNLIVPALQEGRVNGADGKLPRRSQTRGERHRVLLRNADVEKAVGELRREAGKARPELHCRRDRADAAILLGELAEAGAEDGGEAVA